MHNIERFERYVISQKGLLIRDNKALILEMKKYPGKWDLPGGRIDVGEEALKSFDREIVEELNIKKFENLGIIDCHIWYSGEEKTPVCGIINLIKNETEEFVLSFEHSKALWISEDEIDDYSYIWRCMPGIIKKGFLKNALVIKNYEK